MAAGNGHNSPDRLDRIEQIIEVLANTTVDLRQDVKIVLGAQVIMSDQLGKLTVQVAEGFAKLTEAQLNTEERLNALIMTVDEIIRRKKE